MIQHEFGRELDTWHDHRHYDGCKGVEQVPGGRTVRVGDCMAEWRAMGGIFNKLLVGNEVGVKLGMSTLAEVSWW